MEELLTEKEWNMTGMTNSWTEKNPLICSGRLVFKGTRVPVETIFELIRQGASVEELQEDYPNVPYAAIVSFHRVLSK